MPDDSGDLWTALGAVAAGVVAVLAVKISSRLLFIEDTPLLLVKREDGETWADNAGRGVALNIFVCNADNELVDDCPSIMPGSRHQLRGLHLNLHQAYFLYYASITGRWFRSKAIGQSIMGNETSFKVHTRFRRVAGWRVPRRVRKALKRKATSADEYMQALQSLVSSDGWIFRITNTWRATRRWWEIRRWRFGGEKRLSRHWHRMHLERSVPTTPQTTWPIDLGGRAACWHTTFFDILQRGCDQEADGGLAVQIRVQYLHSGFDGVVVISPAAWAELGRLTPEDRCARLVEELRRYICGSRPDKYFAVEINRCPPGRPPYRRRDRH